MEDIEKLLIRLQNAALRERQRIIKDMESQGYIIAFRSGAYEAVDPDGERHTLRRQQCPCCSKTKLISDFWGRTQFMQWCKPCRKADPRGSVATQTAERDRRRTPEENRARERLQQQRHPERRKHRKLRSSEKHLRGVALALIDKDVAERNEVLQQYTRGQREKILEYLAE